jgi:hypothetical protein
LDKFILFGDQYLSGALVTPSIHHIPDPKNRRVATPGCKSKHMALKRHPGKYHQSPHGNFFLMNRREMHEKVHKKNHGR